jgi:hypothetical protein
LIIARLLLNLTEDALWALPDVPMSVSFDDGVLETDLRDTIISWYLWDMVRLHPLTPLNIKHHIGKHRMTSDTHLRVLSFLVKDCFDAYNGNIDREELWKIAQNSTNLAFNRLTAKLEASVSTVSIKDYLEIRKHPVIKAANDNVKLTQASIEETYEIIKECILDPDNFIGNAVAESAKAKLVPMGQVLQCIGPRGVLTDVDSSVFTKPIKTGFVEGLTRLDDSLMESRSASKSLALTKDPLQDSEYFSRQMQLGCVTLRNLNYHDCGSNRYHEFLVHAGDMDALAGKYYLTENGLATFNADDRQLIGTTVKFRSPLHCLDPDEYGICSTCYGEMAYSVPWDTNIGWVDVVVLAEQVTQILLSNKHLDMSASVDDIELTDHERMYIRTEEGSNHVWMARALQHKSVKMIISAKASAGLGDIAHTTDISVLSVQNITGLSDVIFVVTNGNVEDRAIINAAIGKRLASLTHEMLFYLKVHGWALTPTGDYEIDLHQWDFSNPIFELPLRHINMVDYAGDLSSVLIGGGKEKGSSMKTADGLKPLRDFVNADEALLAVYNLVSSKLNVPLVHLECILLALSARDPVNNDFRLPEPGAPIYFGGYTNTMARRSMSALLAHQGQRKVLFDPVTFLVDFRPSHPMDDMFSG